MSGPVTRSVFVSDHYGIKQNIINTISEKILNMTVDKYRDICHDYSRIPKFLELCKEELNGVLNDLFDAAVNEGLLLAQSQKQCGLSEAGSISHVKERTSQKHRNDGSVLNHNGNVPLIEMRGAISHGVTSVVDIIKDDSNNRMNIMDFDCRDSEKCGVTSGEIHDPSYKETVSESFQDYNQKVPYSSEETKLNYNTCEVQSPSTNTNKDTMTSLSGRFKVLEDREEQVAESHRKFVYLSKFHGDSVGVLQQQHLRDANHGVTETGNRSDILSEVRLGSIDNFNSISSVMKAHASEDEVESLLQKGNETLADCGFLATPFTEENKYIKVMGMFLRRLSNAVNDAVKIGFKCRILKWRILLAGLQHKNVFKKHDVDIMQVEYGSDSDNNSFLCREAELKKLKFLFDSKIKVIRNFHNNMETKSNECWINVLIHACRIAYFEKSMRANVNSIPTISATSQHQDILRLNTILAAGQHVREKYSVPRVVHEWNSTIGNESEISQLSRLSSISCHSFTKGCIVCMKPRLSYNAVRLLSDSSDDRCVPDESLLWSNPKRNCFESETDNFHDGGDVSGVTFEENFQKPSAVNIPSAPKTNLTTLSSSTVPSHGNCSPVCHERVVGKYLRSACLRKGPSHSMLGCYYHSPRSKGETTESHDSYPSMRYKLDMSTFPEINTNHKQVNTSRIEKTDESGAVEDGIELRETNCSSSNNVFIGVQMAGTKDIDPQTPGSQHNTGSSSVPSYCKMERLSSWPSRPNSNNYNNNMVPKHASRLNVPKSASGNLCMGVISGKRRPYYVTNTMDFRYSRSLGGKNDKLNQNSLICTHDSVCGLKRGLDVEHFKTLSPSQKNRELIQVMKIDKAQTILARKATENYVYALRDKVQYNNTMTSVEEIDAGVYRTKLYGRGEPRIV